MAAAVTAEDVFKHLEARKIIARKHASTTNSDNGRSATEEFSDEVLSSCSSLSAHAPTEVPPSNPSSILSECESSECPMIERTILCSETELELEERTLAKSQTPMKRSREDRQDRDLKKHSLLPPCACKQKCSEKFDEENRIRIHSEYWLLDCTNRKRFVHHCIERSTPDRYRPRTRNVFEGRKGKAESRKYSFVASDGNRYVVCKSFFMSTLGYRSDAFITNVCNSSSACSVTPPPDKRGRHEPRHKLKREAVEDMSYHIESFNPSVPHYRRQHAPNRRYLPSEITITAMHKHFQERCDTSVSYHTYRRCVKDKNIAFTKLGEEECEVCLCHNQHSHSKPTQSPCAECQEWTQHNENARMARVQYQEDAKADDDAVYLSSDMQKVLLLPRLPGVKSCMFTRRMVVFHQTFAPIGSKKSKARKNRVFSCVWHEGVAGRSAADVTSAYESAIKHFGEAAERVVIWVDNCSAQNKNWTLFSALALLVNSDETAVKEVELRFLEKGHTFMAADSFHAAVEKSMSHSHFIYNLQDLIDSIEEASTISPKVHEMECTDFRDWENAASQRKKDMKHRPLLSTVRIVKFIRGSFQMHFKVDMSQETFEACNFLREERQQEPVHLPSRRSRDRGIEKTKVEDIQSKLCKLMPPSKRLFWANLAVDQHRTDLLTANDDPEPGRWQSPSSSHGFLYEKRPSPSASTGFQEDERPSPSASTEFQEDERPSPSSSPGFQKDERQPPSSSPGFLYEEHQSPSSSSAFQKDERQSPSALPGFLYEERQSPSSSPGFLYEERQSPSSSSAFQKDERQSPSSSPGFLSDERQSPSSLSAFQKDERQSPSPSPGFLYEERQSPSSSSAFQKDERQSLSSSPGFLYEERQSPSASPGFLYEERQSPSASPGFLYEERQSPSSSSAFQKDERQSPSALPGFLYEERQSPSASPGFLYEERQSPSASPGFLYEERQSPSASPGFLYEERQSHSASPGFLYEERQSHSASTGFQREEQRRDAFFKTMQREMCAAETFTEIRNLAQHHQAAMKQFNISCMNLTADNYRTDKISVDLFPSDGPSLTPVTIYGDGNCLPRTGSLFAFGVEGKHVELRMRLACELALHAEFYLCDAFLSMGVQEELPFSKFYATYTPHYTLQVLTPATVRDIFEAEVVQWVKNGTYAGMWEVHALSSVLGTTVHSVYPQYGGFNVRPHLHRTVLPRQRGAVVQRVPGIMWTSTQDSAVPARFWAPNHFVACLP